MGQFVRGQCRWPSCSPFLMANSGDSCAFGQLFSSRSVAGGLMADRGGFGSVLTVGAGGGCAGALPAFSVEGPSLSV